MENNKIIVIDDNVELNHILSSVLREYKYEPHSAYNGEDGLSLIKQIRPFLIILDITMPKMDGMTMLKKLREDEDIKNTKVIVLTNISNSRVVRYAAELGAQNYLLKSKHTYKEVLDIVNKIFSKIK